MVYERTFSLAKLDGVKMGIQEREERAKEFEADAIKLKHELNWLMGMIEKLKIIYPTVEKGNQSNSEKIENFSNNLLQTLREKYKELHADKTHKEYMKEDKLMQQATLRQIHYFVLEHGIAAIYKEFAQRQKQAHGFGKLVALFKAGNNSADQFITFLNKDATNHHFSRMLSVILSYMKEYDSDIILYSDEKKGQITLADFAFDKIQHTHLYCDLVPVNKKEWDELAIPEEEKPRPTQGRSL